MKARRRARNVAEMDKENFICKQVGNFAQVFAHQVKICLAKRNAQRIARANIENRPFYVFFGNHDARDVSDFRKGWIVWVQCEPDTVFFRIGQHRLDKVRIIVPKLLCRDGVLRRGDFGKIERRYGRAAPFGEIRARAQPTDMRHPIEADRSDAEFAHDGEHFQDFFDTGIAPGVARLDVVVQRVRHGLYHDGRDAEVGKPFTDGSPM